VKTRADIFAPRRDPAHLPRVGRRYSRFVYLTKLALPAAALALLLLVVSWSRLEGLFDSVRIPLPRIDLSEARDLSMIKARYTGIDKNDRPFTITADVARQKPKLDGLVALDQPKGDLTTESGNWLQLSATTGLYQPQPQLLDLFGDVELYHDKGNEFHSTSAHIDMATGTAESDDPTTGQGPFGTVTAQGFRIVDRGDTIIFKGHARLEIRPRAGQDP
jgi:lipopolysaccharide export system protein LptC